MLGCMLQCSEKNTRLICYLRKNLGLQQGVVAKSMKMSTIISVKYSMLAQGGTCLQIDCVVYMEVVRSSGYTR